MIKINGTVTPDLTTPESASRPANIKFTGRDELDKRKRKVLRRNDPIENFTIPGGSIELPPADFQKRDRLFYHESAAIIVAAFPQLYKLIRSAKRS